LGGSSHVLRQGAPLHSEVSRVESEVRGGRHETADDGELPPHGKCTQQHTTLTRPELWSANDSRSRGAARATLADWSQVELTRRDREWHKGKLVSGWRS